MDKEIELLIRKSMSRDVQIAMLNKELGGCIITKEKVVKILKELTGEMEIESDEEELSDCCGAEIVEGTFCKKCKEHAK